MRAEEVRAEGFEGGEGEVGKAGEEEDAEGAVEGEGLLEVGWVGGGDARDGARGEDAAGDEGGGGGHEERGRGGVRGAVVVDGGGVGDAVAGGEFAAGFEGGDELVGFGGGGRGGGLGGLADLAGGGLALREERGVFGVEVEEGFGDEFALGFVGLQDGAGGEAGLDVVDFPGEVHGVEEGGVHALAGFGLLGVS